MVRSLTANDVCPAHIVRFLGRGDKIGGVKIIECGNNINRRNFSRFAGLGEVNTMNIRDDPVVETQVQGFAEECCVYDLCQRVRFL